MPEINGKTSMIMMVIAALGVAGYSSGGDEMINQALVFMKDDIKSLDDKLQQEQRLLIDTTDEKIRSLNELLQTEIDAVDHELTTVHGDLHDLEVKHRDDRILFEEKISDLEKKVATLIAEAGS